MYLGKRTTKWEAWRADSGGGRGEGGGPRPGDRPSWALPDPFQDLSKTELPHPAHAHTHVCVHTQYTFTHMHSYTSTLKHMYMHMDIHCIYTHVHIVTHAPGSLLLIPVLLTPLLMMGVHSLLAAPLASAVCSLAPARLYS